MPITQARMLAVIAEAEAARDALISLHESARAILFDRQMRDVVLAFAQLQALIGALRVPALEACTREHNHFLVARKRNAKNAEYMRVRRSTQGSRNMGKGTT